jgi:hypothetical protein
VRTSWLPDASPMYMLETRVGDAATRRATTAAALGRTAVAGRRRDSR